MTMSGCVLCGCGACDVDAAAPATSASSSAARTTASATDAAPPLHPDGGARPDDWPADAGDFLAMLKPPGSTPETSRGFVDMIRVERFCVD